MRKKPRLETSQSWPMPRKRSKSRLPSRRLAARCAAGVPRSAPLRDAGQRSATGLAKTAKHCGTVLNSQDLRKESGGPDCLISAAVGLELFDHEIDAVQQGLDVLRIDGDEGRDAQLVAAQFAVRLHIHHAIGTQGLGNGRGID